MLVSTRTVATALALCASLWLLPPDASAQYRSAPDEVIATGTSYRVFAQPGEPTVTVQVLGDIGGSGIYVVGDRTTLSELIALAGGAPVQDFRHDVRGTYTIRVFRDGAGTRTNIYEARWDDFVRAPGAHPALRDGDVVTLDVTVRERFDVMRTVSVVSGLSALALLVLRLIEGF